MDSDRKQNPPGRIGHTYLYWDCNPGSSCSSCLFHCRNTAPETANYSPPTPTQPSPSRRPSPVAPKPSPSTYGAMPGASFNTITSVGHGNVGIAVGRPVTRPPPHRSRRAELPHRAPPCHSLGTRHMSSQKIWHIFGSGTLKYSSSSAKPVQL